MVRRSFLGWATWAAQGAPSSRTFAYEVWDVFSSKRLLGNPLAVILDARSLREDQLLPIAREMNHSETTFVYPRAKGALADPVKVRIFTRVEELPFAGHPALGTAMAIRSQRGSTSPVTLQLGVGPIPVTFEERASGLVGIMTQRDPDFLEVHTAAEIAPLAGLTPAEIAATSPARRCPQAWSV